MSFSTPSRSAERGRGLALYYPRATAPLLQFGLFVPLTASRFADRPFAPIQGAMLSAMADVPVPCTSTTNPAQCMQRAWRKWQA